MPLNDKLKLRFMEMVVRSLGILIWHQLFSLEEGTVKDAQREHMEDVRRFADDLKAMHERLD